ncbi:hypothetical protein CHGG_07714 [Chaetomium globosum CBS 148.51]|uniref:Cholesterol oxidase n=1 Tax=Chaetomium globosum (strain ATCC 6205 / CBS 148.51 / DSM 1962 / NBRC 6347 / NRRL 1970) TaxID=306901 RepID=Q2GWE0_CHAGB|nr:uncharacterized protein CHGG_07714 [Chaetomium globosum CBS 148.51]EAQ86461.1 hypothetical protein CHGG_07714 [Chaetomium globosum CBS 148.51]
MDKSSARNPSGSLQVNGLLSPPLTPDPNHRASNAMGIIDGAFDDVRPPSPNPSVSSSTGFSSDPRTSSTFTATSQTSSHTAASSPDLSRDDPHPLPPNYAVHDEHEYNNNNNNNKPSLTTATATATSPTSPISPAAHRASTKPRPYTDGRQDAPFPRLSKPVELLRSAYDVVVIGSGYGGGVPPSRKARTGVSLFACSSAAREKWPGRSTPAGAIDAGEGAAIIRACSRPGLGGTSLINANVFMEADKETLAMKAWPPEIRENVEELDKYYKKVEEVLDPQEYPAEWPELPKAKLLQKQAELMGLGGKFKKVRQTTRFINGPNSCGVEMSPSSLTGQDATGVNDGSKNTTLVTYIADAWNWGAELFCECEVRYIEEDKNGEGYLRLWGLSTWCLTSNSYNTDETANAIGQECPSPYHPIGPTITSVIDCREDETKPDFNPLDGFVLEEGAIPHALAPLFQAMIDLMPGKKDPQNDTLIEKTQAALARYSSRFLGPYYKNGAVQKTQVYLIMSHDSNQAVLSLKDDKPMLEFLGVARGHHVKKLNKLLERATEVVGGTLVQSPFYELLGQQVTVHPIGGACMARDNTGKTGVTNHVGKVFRGRNGETHDGLIVTDGSVIPTALAANPFATIAALAERSVEAYAKSQGLTISEEKNAILDLLGEPQHKPKRMRPSHKREQINVLEEQDSISVANKVIRSARDVSASGIGFTEVMSGFIHPDEDLKEDNKDTYELAHRMAKSLCESARFFLSVQAFNTKEMVNHAQHRGMLTGTFVCPAIRGSPFMVQRGEFNLFILNNKAPGTRNLTYDFDMTGVDGRKLHFHGYKVVDSSVALAPFQFWKATSTLYVTISQHVPYMCADLDDEDAWRRAPVIAKGIMHIQPADFFSQINTMTPTGSNLLKKAISAVRFLTYFTRKSLSLFLSPLTPLEYPTKTFSGFINHTPADKSVEILASDGVSSRMHIWEPTHVPGNDPKNIRNLFMIPGASVDHQIFALPTIPYNAVNYLTRAGYRVFVSVHRISQLMIAGSNWTTYDARLDLKACLEHIRDVYGPEKIYTIAHCMGSVAFASGLLDGTIPASWILGITCSQVFMNPVWGPTNMAKVMAGPLPMDRLYDLFAGSWFSCSTSHNDTLVQKAVNQALRLYPQARREMCNNAACHRTSLVFGRCWNHANLNEATHRQIDRFFGGVNMRQLNLLMKMGYDGHVMGNAPLYEPLTSEANIERLRGIPVMLFVGRDNAVLSPEATERTYETLCDAFEDGEYKRKVVPGYGHLDGWMGRNAWKDVYPFVREEVDRVTRGEAYEFVEPDDRFKAMVHGGELLY